MMDQYDRNTTFRAMLAYRAQNMLLSVEPIPNSPGEYQSVGLTVVATLLGESLGTFIETIVEDMVEIDAWNK